ncbi:MAG: hydroxyacylglutathione hydrolase, partial [Methylococcales bacterium]|nr:hydroxyacylglutathione hydrolase [Methylococcales bacterium]
EPISAKTAVVDPAVCQPVLDKLKQKSWSLDYIFNTHHHSDHIGANLELKAATNCQILAAKADQHRIPGIDKALKNDDEITLGKEVIKVIETPGHTLGHIVFHFYNSNNLFCGDTLFSMGCGRLFEGSAEQMWHSLQRLKALPKETKIYCAHEYTLANGNFALTLEPKNQALKLRILQVNQLRADNKPTIPSTLEQELATNPFLREDSLELQQSINRVGKPAIEVFRHIRKLKDSF